MGRRYADSASAAPLSQSLLRPAQATAPGPASDPALPRRQDAMGDAADENRQRLMPPAIIVSPHRPE